MLVELRLSGDPPGLHSPLADENASPFTLHLRDSQFPKHTTPLLAQRVRVEVPRKQALYSVTRHLAALHLNGRLAADETKMRKPADGQAWYA